MSEVTSILDRLAQGDDQAGEQLLTLMYDELRRLAAAKLRNEKPGNTLQATALVHEVYLRLLGGSESQSWDNRGHFFAAAAEAMRRILVDRARQKNSLKRGGDLSRRELSDLPIATPNPNVDLISLNDALEKLETHDSQKATLVKLRYFAGLTIPQAAEALGIGKSTADKYWAYAKCWLRAEMDR